MRDLYPSLTLPSALPLPGGLKPGSAPCAACAARVLSVCDAIEGPDLPRLAALSKPRVAEAHYTFVSAGEPADQLFNITEGIVKVYRLLPDGRQQVTGFLSKGDFLGLGAEGTYSFSAEAVTQVRYCRFERDALYKLMSEFPKVEKRLLAMTVSELSAAHEQMLLLGRKSAQERLASFLVMLSRRMGRLGERDDVIALPMTRLDIADYLGLTIETVSRTFTQFRKQGLIVAPRVGRVRLKNYAALVLLSEGLGTRSSR